MARPFVFVLHHHQPPHNLRHVMDRALRDCYRPLLDALEAHPEVRVTLHYSGALLEWLKTHAPDFMAQIRALVSTPRAELLGGGFYEPVLTQIPEPDATGQLAMMGMFCERYLGVRPRGAWLTERVWEPELPRLLFNQKLAYTFVDDRHFLDAGLSAEEVGGHFVTERAGAPVSLFPIHRSLRYAIPFNAPDDVIRTIVESPGDGAVVYADDAEKLGLWPDTHRWVFEQGWLERFLAAMDEAQTQGRVETKLPTELLESTPPRGRVYLAQGAYDELMTWALPAAASRERERTALTLEERQLADVATPRVQGRNFGAFLAKYPEADRLHKKMLRVSDRMQSEMEVAIDASEGGGLSDEVGDHLGTAQRALYRGQTACVYWHGLFGGIYTAHLRRGAHAALLEAERILDALQQGEDDYVAYEEEDLDLDGREEVVLESRYLHVVVRPHGGGTVVDCDDKLSGLAIADVVARHAEPYRDGPVDVRPRALFVDRVLPRHPEPEVLAEAESHDRSGLPDVDYAIESLDVAGEDSDDVVTVRLDVAADAARLPVAVKKTVALDMEQARLTVDYCVTNTGEGVLEGAFVVEVPTTFVGPAGADITAVVDAESGVEVALEAQAERRHAYALEVTTRREDGLHPTLLGRVEVLAFDLDLAPGAHREFSVVLTSRPAR
ncbi:MAG: DUF1925 domain-containing protein [Deltaproteobacteria bacterium]